MPKKSLAMNFIDQLYCALEKEFPNPRTPLKYKAPHELAIAVILSAQCTDEQVNRVTPSLFKNFPTLESLSKASRKELERIIYSTGFYKNKAKNIHGFCQALLKEYKSSLPQNHAELIKMPGVGRKTANVILQELYRLPSGVVVDTHVARISRVLGLSKEKDPYKIEKDLMAKIPKKYWIDFSLFLIFLGRKYCKARQRFCQQCPLVKICPSSESKTK